jgi:thiol-disulfide isomerase/thioredoxin
MIRQLARIVIAVAVTFSGMLSLKTLQAAKPPTAAELVQGVIDAESKISDVQSLYLRFEGKWTNTPEAIAEHRAELEKEFRGVEIDIRQHRDLWPELTEELELAFDQHRVRFFSDQHKACRDLRVSDGTRAIFYEKYFTHEQEGVVLRSAPAPELFGSFITDLSWLRVGGASFWFNGGDAARQATVELNGRLEDYELVREEALDGRDCYVVRNVFARCELHIGKEDRRLYRLTYFTLDSGADFDRALEALEKVAGRSFANSKEYETWDKALSEPERAAFAKRFQHEVFPISRPWVAHYLNDYREVKPGFWIPFSQGYTFFDRREPPQAKTSRELHLVDAKVNEPLPDELFVTEFELQDGISIADYTHDPPLFYEHKANRTPEEFQAIVEECNRANEAWQKQQAARDALIGQPAPELPQSGWLNSDRLDWAALKGKVVLLDFWSVSCGPCRNDLPQVETLHRQRGDSGLVAISVHAAGATKEEVEQFTKEMDLTFPVAIDVRADNRSGFGRFFNQVQVNAIPYTFLIDRDGKVAAHGRLHEVISKAYELAATAEAEKE